MLLVLLWFVNYAETALDPWFTSAVGLSKLRTTVARTNHQLEAEFLSFHGHDAANPISVYGYSAAYFLVFPVMVIYVFVALLRSPDPRPCRTFSLAVALNYALYVPFYLFWPLPERWSFPDSGAILLSDRWSTWLIIALRPFSGLDNCFPSFHVSMTVVTVGLGYWYGVRFRNALLPLGAMVVFSTFVLGIHWVGDIVGGLGAGLVCIALGDRMAETLGRKYQERAQAGTSVIQAAPKMIGSRNPPAARRAALAKRVARELVRRARSSRLGLSARRRRLKPRP
jgi:membrane-associated phospholipid phosphatase